MNSRPGMAEASSPVSSSPVLKVVFIVGSSSGLGTGSESGGVYWMKSLLEVLDALAAVILLWVAIL